MIWAHNRSVTCSRLYANDPSKCFGYESHTLPLDQRIKQLTAKFFFSIHPCMPHHLILNYNTVTVCANWMIYTIWLHSTLHSTVPHRQSPFHNNTVNCEHKSVDYHDFAEYFIHSINPSNLAKDQSMLSRYTADRQTDRQEWQSHLTSLCLLSITAVLSGPHKCNTTTIQVFLQLLQVACKFSASCRKLVLQRCIAGVRTSAIQLQYKKKFL